MGQRGRGSPKEGRGKGGGRPSEATGELGMDERATPARSPRRRTRAIQRRTEVSMEERSEKQFLGIEAALARLPRRERELNIIDAGPVVVVVVRGSHSETVSLFYY